MTESNFHKYFFTPEKTALLLLDMANTVREFRRDGVDFDLDDLLYAAGLPKGLTTNLRAFELVGWLESEVEE